MLPSPSGKTRPFRELCAEHAFTATHQRQVVYEVMQMMPGHPSPEEVYARVKRRIPAISLATVYKIIHLFVEKGLLKKVSMHHGSLRIELNTFHHHHAVCSHCKAITDIEEKYLGGFRAVQDLPGGFQVERYSIDVIGICAACRRANAVKLLPHAESYLPRSNSRGQEDLAGVDDEPLPDNSTRKEKLNGQRTN